MTKTKTPAPADLAPNEGLVVYDPATRMYCGTGNLIWTDRLQCAKIYRSPANARRVLHENPTMGLALRRVRITLLN